MSDRHAPLSYFESGGQQYVTAAITTAAVTLLGWVIRPWIGYQTVALVYLSAVVLLARFIGRGPILFCGPFDSSLLEFPVRPASLYSSDRRSA